MKKTSKKAFSLSEMMVVMLIMTIVMAASAPIITKKSARPASVIAGAIPAGTIVPYSGLIGGPHAVPAGWLECNGQKVSKTSFAPLYDALGGATSYPYGTSGSDFILPDLRGRVIVGFDKATNNAVASDRVPARTDNQAATTLGASGGKEAITLQVSEMPSHTHTGKANLAGRHNHPLGGIETLYNNGYTSVSTGESASLLNNANRAYASGGISTYNFGWTGPEEAHEHTLTVDPKGDGGMHNNMPPYIVLHYLIKT